MEVFVVFRRVNGIDSISSVKLSRIDALELANDLNEIAEGNVQHFVKVGEVSIKKEEFELDLSLDLERPHQGVQATYYTRDIAIDAIPHKGGNNIDVTPYAVRTYNENRAALT